ncbi:hypothetical protein NY08_3333 [Rhodococcus sp. B7740]|nr:hypothetical protein NY08_3333 [Rhodococcus sp. B7740]
MFRVQPGHTGFRSITGTVYVDVGGQWSGHVTTLRVCPCTGVRPA